jgi:hypothetical protein
MGQNPDQTRAEIVQLRAEMTQRVEDIKRAARRPARIARAVAVGTVAAIVVGGVVLVAWRVRQGRRRVTLEERVRRAAKDVAGQPGKIADRARARLREELREEVRRETRPAPLHERMLENAARTAARTAAAAAVGAALKGLQQEREKTAAGGRR